jgi:hypothetical protein
VVRSLLLTVEPAHDYRIESGAAFGEPFAQSARLFPPNLRQIVVDNARSGLPVPN